MEIYIRFWQKLPISRGIHAGHGKIHTRFRNSFVKFQSTKFLKFIWAFTLKFRVKFPCQQDRNPNQTTPILDNNTQNSNLFMAKKLWKKCQKISPLYFFSTPRTITTLFRTGTGTSQKMAFSKSKLLLVTVPIVVLMILDHVASAEGRRKKN